ncbi:3-oxosteroid 1-dehydrogenase [BD1-7 clade bacterium]|uniref:3-oxosteroid 1-dehydrogenase n=1 Tax=BD1-7 clade bacterium TaxID=2029982 RepID=A0A5S9P6Z5_9GAMM|nr:3-oxosteroid 1-dehydrogenase [BD1-7 clade bacterium]CAA0099414.1 3-oxosteroid 1-dehydrogenase [BD1-7 clade bacterium]
MSESSAYDVIVVGSGPAGLMAALRSATLGKKVALIESENQIGGTGRGSAYGIWIPQNRLLRDRGIKEDKDACLRWMCKHAYPNQYTVDAPFYGIPELDYRQFSAYFENAGQMLDFLEDESGVEIVFMRNHGDDQDTYDANRALMKARGLPDDPDLVRALPDYHPEDEDNEVPVGRYVNFRTDMMAITLYFIAMFRQMDAKLLVSAVYEMLRPSVLLQVARGFFSKNDEGAFYYCGAGIRMTRAFKALLLKYRVDVLTSTTVDDVLFNASGAVSGVQVRPAGKNVSGNTRELHAPNVVLTVGGFAHNQALLNKYASEFPVQRCASRPTCDGALLETLEDRVKLGHMADVWQTESLLALTRNAVVASDFIGSTNVWHLNGDSAIVVDQRGQRCYNEMAQYSMRSKWYRSPDKEIAVYVFDERTIRRFGGLLGTWSAHLPYLTGVDAVRPSFVVAGDSFDDLSDNLREHLVPFESLVNCSLSADFADNLAASVTRFNGFARDGVDEDFGRGGSLANLGWRAKRAPDNHFLNKTMYPISEDGPYYAMVLCLSCFNTKGGFQTDEHARVLSHDEQPIKGLYAAGNCAASPSNTGYVLSTIGPAMTFAWMAANHIAEH